MLIRVVCRVEVAPPTGVLVDAAEHPEPFDVLIEGMRVRVAPRVMTLKETQRLVPFPKDVKCLRALEAEIVYETGSAEPALDHGSAERVRDVARRALSLTLEQIREFTHDPRVDVHLSTFVVTRCEGEAGNALLQPHQLVWWPGPVGFGTSVIMPGEWCQLAENASSGRPVPPEWHWYFDALLRNDSANYNLAVLSIAGALEIALRRRLLLSLVVGGANSTSAEKKVQWMKIPELLTELAGQGVFDATTACQIKTQIFDERNRIAHRQDQHQVTREAAAKAISLARPLLGGSDISGQLSHSYEG